MTLPTHPFSISFRRVLIFNWYSSILASRAAMESASSSRAVSIRAALASASRLISSRLRMAFAPLLSPFSNRRIASAKRPDETVDESLVMSFAVLRRLPSIALRRSCRSKSSCRKSASSGYFSTLLLVDSICLSRCKYSGLLPAKGMFLNSTNDSPSITTRDSFTSIKESDNVF